MKLYLMRHGEAEIDGLDKDRILSIMGRQDVSLLAGFLRPLHIEVTHFFHSDKTRAIETANIMATAIRTTEPRMVRQELDPISPIETIVTELPTCVGDVFLVGHMPYMGKLASYLATGDELLAQYDMLPGTLLCFESVGYFANWQLRWMLSPQLLRPCLAVS